jgi:gliding motility-associated-like protein
VHIYDEPKSFPVQLQVWDEHGCQDDTVRLVTYKPAPALLIVKPNDTIGCPPAKVRFNNLSQPVDNSYQVTWHFGDSTIATGISPTHIYEAPGTYDVRLEITSPIGCYTDTVFEQLVQVLPPPVANFTYSPARPSNFEPEVTFDDSSSFAVHWDWYLDGRLIAQQPDFTYTLPDTGLHEVMLIITHPEQCQDTLIQYLDVEPKVTFFLPNAFTPNEDTVNDFFKGSGYTRGATDFRMEIWDRNGSLVFATMDIEDAWNGRINNTGRFAPNGVYVCVVTFREPRGKPFEYRGYATLIR